MQTVQHILTLILYYTPARYISIIQQSKHISCILSHNYTFPFTATTIVLQKKKKKKMKSKHANTLSRWRGAWHITSSHRLCMLLIAMLIASFSDSATYFCKSWPEVTTFRRRCSGALMKKSCNSNIHLSAGTKRYLCNHNVTYNHYIQLYQITSQYKQIKRH